MSVYILPIKTAFIMFSVLGFLLVIPWLVYSYRKYGYFSRVCDDVPCFTSYMGRKNNWNKFDAI